MGMFKVPSTFKIITLPYNIFRINVHAPLILTLKTKLLESSSLMQNEFLKYFCYIIKNKWLVINFYFRISLVINCFVY